MYFLVLLFTIVVLKLYINHVYKIKENFFFRDILDTQNNKVEEKSPEHKSLIERIRLKFKDLQSKQKIIASIKEETNENKIQGMNILNENTYKKRLLNR